MNRSLILATLIVAAIPFALPAAAQDAVKPPPPTQIMERIAPAIVSLKCVLKVQMSMMGQSQDEERNRESRGVLVTDTGLVMTSNSAFGLPAALERMLGGQIEVKATPTDIKVLFGSEVEEHEAVIVARDSNLDLAFVQILDLGDAKVPFVDLTPGAAKPQVGVESLAVTRLARGFDCVPAVARVEVLAAIEKPRRMWAVDGSSMALGHPVFDLFGQPIGVLSVQSGSEGVEESSGGLDLFGMADSASGIAAVLLPLEDVHKSLQMALKRAEEAIAEHKAKPAEEPKPTEEPKPAEEPKPTEEPKPPEAPKPPDDPPAGGDAK